MPNQSIIDSINAQLNPAGLSTGIGLRDRHMREKIFTASDGTPEMRFHDESIVCRLPANAPQAPCEISGTITLRGISRPLRMTMRLRIDGNPANYRATADGSLRLSDFGIEHRHN
jgi:polyisoprenoid-binding protein YceI